MKDNICDVDLHNFYTDQKLVNSVLSFTVGCEVFLTSSPMDLCSMQYRGIPSTECY